MVERHAVLAAPVTTIMRMAASLSALTTLILQLFRDRFGGESLA